ncbi:MAG: sulfotransferase [Pirellulales bacterium]|nr:sulfotransferase [Pirellulales bacterium]
MADKNTDEKKQSTGGSKDRFWVPRFWNGMGVGAWAGLVKRNRFAIDPRCYAMAGIMTGLAGVNAAMWAMQELILGRKIRNTQIEKHPIFIIGHWRSGTTLLHELLVLDEQHTFPDTYACFSPNHFLATNWIIPKMLWFLMPARRPMDNMPVGWARPQEDEFAMCNMGMHSPYLTLAFPNHEPQDQQYLDLDNLSPEELDEWKKTFHWFLQCLTKKSPEKRIVLKSPPHTCRIKHLLDIFPQARFVHIVRDPKVIFPSTINLWKRLYRDQGFQIPKYKGLEEHVFSTFTRMYEIFQRDRDLIPAEQFSEIRYEDLVKQPLDELERIYAELRLDGYEEALPALQNHVSGWAEYKTNRYVIDPKIENEIEERWGDYARRYGYAENTEK